MMMEEPRARIMCAICIMVPAGTRGHFETNQASTFIRGTAVCYEHWGYLLKEVEDFEKLIPELIKDHEDSCTEEEWQAHLKRLRREMGL